MQGIRKSLALVATLALAAASAVASTARDVTVGIVAGGFLAAQLAFGALCFMPATIAQTLGLPSAKLERAGMLAHYHTAAAFAHMRHMLGSALLSFMGRSGLLLHVFPQTVAGDLAFGVVGELAFDGPYRSQPARINDASGNTLVGRYFTLDAAGTAQAGGAGTIGGVLMAPKNYANLGTSANGSLAPNMVVPNGVIGEFCYMGAIVVAVGAAVAIGQAAKYTTATGVIGVGAPAAGELAIPNSKFIRYANAAAGLAVLELTN
jgi:hypothetical protein